MLDVLPEAIRLELQYAADRAGWLDAATYLKHLEAAAYPEPVNDSAPPAIFPEDDAGAPFCEGLVENPHKLDTNDQQWVLRFLCREFSNRANELPEMNPAERSRNEAEIKAGLIRKALVKFPGLALRRRKGVVAPSKDPFGMLSRRLNDWLTNEKTEDDRQRLNPAGFEKEGTWSGNRFCEMIIEGEEERAGEGVIVLPEWFVSAAKFFYSHTNRTETDGSVPEAIRRVISLPVLPPAWETMPRFKKKFLKYIGEPEMPTFPPELAKLLREREREGKPFVTRRIAKMIPIGEIQMSYLRNPRETRLRYFTRRTGTMALVPSLDGSPTIIGKNPIARAGDIIEVDDGSINFEAWVDWPMGGCPCSDKYGVKVGRFQWLVGRDVETLFIPAWSYIIRARASYRREDIGSLLRALAVLHGVPDILRLEQGLWKTDYVKEIIRLMGSKLQTVYQPNHKPFIEGLFNDLWKKLSVAVPGAQIGRYRGEMQRENKILAACQRGGKDPRRYFPSLQTVLDSFNFVIAEKNQTPVKTNRGKWVPAERWQEQTAERPLKQFDREREWIFSPFVQSCRVRGAMISSKLPGLIEDRSIPFEFGADFLVEYDGALVKAFFNLREDASQAMIVLDQNWNGLKKGELLGKAHSIGDLREYARFVMGLDLRGDSAEWLVKQKNYGAVWKESRGVLPTGEVIGKGEIHDGLLNSVQVDHEGEKKILPAKRVLTATEKMKERFLERFAGEPASERTAEAAQRRQGRPVLSGDDVRAARLRDAEKWENDHPEWLL